MGEVTGDLSGVVVGHLIHREVSEVGEVMGVPQGEGVGGGQDVSMAVEVSAEVGPEEGVATEVELAALV